MTTTVTIDQMVARWSDPVARPLFRGKLIDDHGCCCAQGDVLRLCGWSDDQLRRAEQHDADRAVAQNLGISITQSILLRQVSDNKNGCPQDVLAHPEKILGDQAPRVLEFWRRLDVMTKEQWATVKDAAKTAAKTAAKDTAWAWDPAKTAAKTAAETAAGDAAWAAAWATNEIQGAVYLKTFFFLPMFGIDHPSELDKL